MLSPPDLAELSGAAALALRWLLSPAALKLAEQGWPRAQWAALGIGTPREGAGPGNASSEKGKGVELTQRENPAFLLLLLPEDWKGRCGCLLPEGVGPCCHPCRPLSALATASSHSSAASLLVQGCGMAKASCFATDSLPPKGTSNITSVLLLDCVEMILETCYAIQLTSVKICI